jgi:hypothetical protein
VVAEFCREIETISAKTTVKDGFALWSIVRAGRDGPSGGFIKVTFAGIDHYSSATGMAAAAPVKIDS